MNNEITVEDWDKLPEMDIDSSPWRPELLRVEEEYPVELKKLKDALTVHELRERIRVLEEQNRILRENLDASYNLITFIRRAKGDINNVGGHRIYVIGHLDADPIDNQFKLIQKALEALKAAEEVE